MRRFYLPLYAKILLWFGLNVVLLAAGFYVFIGGQLDLGGTLLAGHTGKRIRDMADAFATAAPASRPEEWKGILDRFSSAYNVELSLAGEDGRPIAAVMGEFTYPAEILRILSERGSKPPNRREPRFRQRPTPGDERSRLRPPPRGGRDGDRDRRLPPRREGRSGKLSSSNQGDPDAKLRPSELLFLTSRKVEGRYWFAVRVAHRYQGAAGPQTAILVGSTDSLSASRLLPDIKPWLIFGAIAFGASLILWMPLVLRITRYLRQMTRATEDIAFGRFDISVSEDRHDELGKLGAAINHMARRLNGYVSGQKRFLGDIAHELCSPVARMQMSLGLLERRLPDEHAEALSDLREEADHMSTMVNELLSFSRSSLRESTIQLESVDLREVIDLALQRESAATEEVTVEIEGAPRVIADPNLLQRAIANIVRNAILYAGEAGPISIQVDQANEEETQVRVSDRGEGVPEEAIEHLFEPFYRPETARTRETGGTGLGLSIVKMCVESCRGTVSVTNLEPVGFEVALLLRSA